MAWPPLHLLVLGEPGFVVDFGGHQGELVTLSKDTQQQHHSAAATLPHPVVDYLAREWQHLAELGHKGAPVSIVGLVDMIRA